jgi:drug/metabolite transporter (DMT)-like permease
VPLASVLIAPLFGNRERFGTAAITGLLVGIAGVALIVGFDLRASSPIALLEMAGVVICYSLGPAILARFLTGVPSITVNGAALALCCIAYAPLAVLTWPHATPSLSVIGAVLVLAVVCTVAAFLLFFALIVEIGPVRALVITYVNPAVAAVLGVAVLHENLTPGMGAGFVLVLAGSILSTRRGTVAEASAVPERGESLVKSL